MGWTEWQNTERILSVSMEWLELGWGVHKDGVSLLEDAEIRVSEMQVDKAFLIPSAECIFRTDKYEQVGNQDNQEGKKILEACHKDKD